MKKKILITGESGFIGSHVVDHFVKTYPQYEIHGLDCLTYASNKEYTNHLHSYPNYHFIHQDICNRPDLLALFDMERYTDVIHLAAESHVDNSISNPLLFAETNVLGTINLLDAFKKFSKGRFHHVSTDEVYGDLTLDDPAFTEDNSYEPSSPYSASKAASDHFVRAYHRTFNIDITITNCSNNYGPNQHDEKFIPTVIRKISKDQKIPIYGKGENVRDWLYVKDHVKAIDLVFHKGKSGDTYNVGGNNEISNLELVKKILSLMGKDESLISFVEDRAGHDYRYAVNCNKLVNELLWNPSVHSFEDNLLETIKQYQEKKV